MGIIIGEYTNPTRYPALYIIDSQNARALQCNLPRNETTTHRQLFRNVYQGISQSLTKHLDLLSKQWPKEADLEEDMVRVIQKRNGILQSGADTNEIRVTETEDTGIRQTTKIQWGEAANENETIQEQEWEEDEEGKSAVGSEEDEEITSENEQDSKSINKG